MTIYIQIKLKKEKMKKLIPFPLLFLIFSLASPQLYSQKLDDQLIVGDWQQMDRGDFKYSFFQDGTYKLYLSGFELKTSSKKSAKANTYKVELKSDTLWLYLTEYNVNVNFKVRKKFTQHYALQTNGDNYLTIISYKEAKSIYNHIDEYSIYQRERAGSDVAPKTGKHIKYVFPKGFKGAAWIAFNQKDGVDPVYDSLGNAILYIPDNGLLLTKLHEEAFATAQKNYSIVENDILNENSCKTFDGFEKIDSSCCSQDEFIAVMEGFNRVSREDIEKYIFKRSITGNVMTICIGDLKWVVNRKLYTRD